MKLRTAAVAALVALPAASHAAQPAIIVLPTLTSARVKIVASGAYQAGTTLTYTIRHSPDNAILASGQVPAAQITPDALGYPTFQITGLQPLPWSLTSPNLYRITVLAQNGQTLGDVRFGFRTFEAKNQRFYLNGRPVFLKSIPINPPGRELPSALATDPVFIRKYLQLHKAAGVNLIRTDTDAWLDVCDELGIMVSQANYGSAPGGTASAPPSLTTAKPAYRSIILGLANHPSVTVYILTNEVDRAAYKTFLQAIHDDLMLLDDTRPMIGNAGFGYGDGGEIYDIHRYTGWYYGNLHEWYDYNDYIVQANTAGKPLTYSENVAAYTSDSGVFQTVSKQMATMLHWSGVGTDQRGVALEFQAEIVRQTVEIARRCRSSQGLVAGVMPFTYFIGWSSAAKAEDLIIKPAFETLKTVFQPVLISPECWKRHVFAGSALQMRLCVANDDDTGRNLAASTALVQVCRPDGSAVASGQASFPSVPYFTNAWVDVSIVLPGNLPRADYTVRCRLVENGVTISTNSFEIMVAPRVVPAITDRVKLYDPKGTTSAALTSIGIPFDSVSSLSALPSSGVLVIGEAVLSSSGAYPSRTDVTAFLSRGGRILCLRQPDGGWTSDWLGVTWTMSASYRQTYIQPLGENRAIFRDLRAKDLRIWNQLSSYSNGTPTVEPVISLLWPAATADLAPCRVWAGAEQLLSGAALLEVFQGTGSIIISQFRTVERVAGDPAAAQLLSNLVSYAFSPDHTARVDLTRPVDWGLDAMRTGVFVSRKQGFFLHSPVYTHTGTSKGQQGADHRIDGMTLVGDYSFNRFGWVTPVPDPAMDGWGVFYGTLSRPVTRFWLKLRNTSAASAAIKLKLDGIQVGGAVSVSAGQEQTIQWTLNRASGPVTVELQGDQDLVLIQSAFD